MGVEGDCLGCLDRGLIVAHEVVCRQLGLEGMLDAVDEGATFCSSAIHIDQCLIGWPDQPYTVRTSPSSGFGCDRECSGGSSSDEEEGANEGYLKQTGRQESDV